MRESDGRLLTVVYLGPHLDNVHIVVGTIAHGDVEGIYAVFELHFEHFGVLFGCSGVAINIHLKSHVAIGMAHRKCSSRFAYHSIYRISVLACCSASLECGYVGISQLVAIIHKFECSTLGGIHYERCLGCRHADILGIGSA